jgi:hypothetical protein
LRGNYPLIWNELDTTSRYYDDYWSAFSSLGNAATKFAFDPAFTEKYDERVRALAFTLKRWVRIRAVAVGGFLMVGSVYMWLKLL